MKMKIQIKLFVRAHIIYKLKTTSVSLLCGTNSICILL